MLGHLALVLGENGPETVVVTRHPSLIVFLKTKGMIPANTKIISHVNAPEEIRGKHVIGVLPLHWAAVAERVTEVPLDLPPEARGRELSIEEIERFAWTPRTYKVTQLGFGAVSDAEELARRFPALPDKFMDQADMGLRRATWLFGKGEYELAEKMANSAGGFAEFASDFASGPDAKAKALKIWKEADKLRILAAATRASLEDVFEFLSGSRRSKGVYLPPQEAIDFAKFILASAKGEVDEGRIDVHHPWETLMPMSRWFRGTIGQRVFHSLRRVLPESRAFHEATEDQKVEMIKLSKQLGKQLERHRDSLFHIARWPSGSSYHVPRSL